MGAVLAWGARGRDASFSASRVVEGGWSAARKNLAITYELMGRVDQARQLWEELTTDNRLRGEALSHLRDLDESVPSAANP